MPAGQGVVRGDKAPYLGRYDKTDISSAKLGERHGPPGPVGFIGESGFPAADIGDGQSQFAIPFHRIHAKVQMGIDDKHNLWAAYRMIRPVEPCWMNCSISDFVTRAQS